MPLVPTVVADPPNCIRVTCLISPLNEQTDNTIHLNYLSLLFSVLLYMWGMWIGAFMSELRDCVHRLVVRTGILLFFFFILEANILLITHVKAQ